MMRRPMMTMFATSLLAVTFDATAAGAASADAPRDASADAAIREAGRTWLADHNGIGLTIGVFDNGQRRFFNFGVTQQDSNKLPTKDTVYEVGGISRTIAGQLLARAIFEGRANLLDPVTKYLDAQYPNLANGGEPLRLKHLVSSTSQLVDNVPDTTQVRPVAGQPLAAGWQLAIEKYTPAEFAFNLHGLMPRTVPGTTPAPSNVGGMVLAVVLEKIYGEPFETILAREIEKPFRMGSGTAPPAKLLAPGHSAANEPLPAFAPKMPFLVNALRYSADDLLKFCSWQSLEQSASVKLAHQPAWSSADGRVSIGFFWVAVSSAHGRRLNSTGATYGFASLCDLYPDEKIAVVALANKNADGAQESLRALSAGIVSLLRPSAGKDSAN
jgi:serine-type D-Ala-D-Ala carboxypeptidase/endopeptidase